MKTKRLILRHFQKDDAEDMFQYAGDKETTKFLTWPTHKDINHSKMVIEKFYMNDPGNFAITLNGECIGNIGLSIDNQNDYLEFGIVLNKKYQGNGYANEVLLKIIEFCFHQLEVKTIIAKHFIENKASQKMLLRCGMKEVKHSQLEAKGKIFETIEYIFESSNYLTNKGSD